MQINHVLDELNSPCAPAGHGGASVESQIEDGVLKAAGIDIDRRQILGELGLDGNAFAERPPQQAEYAR